MLLKTFLDSHQKLLTMKNKCVRIRETKKEPLSGQTKCIVINLTILGTVVK